MFLQSIRSRRYRSYYEQRRRRKRLRGLVLLLVGWYVVYQLVSVFLLTSFEVRSSSMLPTFFAGDRILATPLTYGPTVPYTRFQIPAITEPASGEVVVIRPPYVPEQSLLIRLVDPVVRFFTLQHVTLRQPVFGQDDPSRLLKRIIAVPGDTVRVQEFVAYVQPAGESRAFSELQLHAGEYAVQRGELPEGYRPEYALSGNMDERTLGPDEYFVLGDNRPASLDSRAWGVVKREEILAKVIWRYWPLSHFGIP